MLKVYACYPRRRTLWTQNGAQITVVATLSIDPHSAPPQQIDIMSRP